MAWSYEEILEKQPRSTETGDRIVAREFCDILAIALQGHGTGHLTEAQRNYLYKLRGKWLLRAEGKDVRWNESGNKPGRRRKLAKNPVDYRREEEEDPLLASLLRKFAKPLREDA